eukprot:TRINITY_DN10956_c0_g1_i1.p1 TRINITY_DN10956_c0_g1~~TRINITY_DN10956_c0_g1_i1.p1  ORF type:complete len:1593 (+),score=169.69 TRINITY_DN10956_c0_g1_i1:137-4915(+)
MTIPGNNLNQRTVSDSVSNRTDSGGSSFNLNEKTGRWHDDFIDILTGKAVNNKFGDRPRVNIEVLGAIPLRLYFVIGLALTVSYGVLETYPGSYKWDCSDECGRPCDPDTADLNNPVLGPSIGCNYIASDSSFYWNGFIDVQSYSYDVLFALGLDSVTFDVSHGNAYYSFMTNLEVSYYNNTIPREIDDIYIQTFEVSCYGTDCAWILVRGIPVGSRTGRWKFSLTITPTGWALSRLSPLNLNPRIVVLHQKPAYTQAEAALRIVLICFTLHQIPYFMWKNFGKSRTRVAWLTEQIWIAFGLFFLLCYLNPMFLPAILHREETGTTGVAYRVFELFFSKVYYAYLMAILSLIPVHIAFQDIRRMWVVFKGRHGFFLPSLFVLMLLIAFIVLTALSFADVYDEVTFYGDIDRNDKYGLTTVENVLTWSWLSVIVVSLCICRYRLKQVIYTKSRLRVLSFRAFLLFPVPCITVAVIVRIYHYYQPTALINVVENASQGIPTILISSIFMLFLSYLYLPTYSPRMFSPPPPHQQAWIHWSWSEDWQLWWRQYGKSMYFFTLEEEVRIFEDKQKEHDTNSVKHAESRDYIETLFEKQGGSEKPAMSTSSPKHAVVKFRDLVKKGERVSSKDRDPNVTQTAILSELFQKNDRGCFRFSFLRNSAPNQQLLLSRNKRLDHELHTESSKYSDGGDLGSTVPATAADANEVPSAKGAEMGFRGVNLFQSLGDLCDIQPVSRDDIAVTSPDILPENPMWKMARAMKKRTSMVPTKLRDFFNDDTASAVGVDGGSTASNAQSVVQNQRQTLNASDMHVFCWESAVDCVNASWLAYLHEDQPIAGIPQPEDGPPESPKRQKDKTNDTTPARQAPFQSSSYLKSEHKKNESYITWYSDYKKALPEYRDPGNDDPVETTIRHERCDLYMKGIREMQNSSMGQFRWSEVYQKGGGTEDVLLDPENGRILSQRTTQDWRGLWAMDASVHTSWIQTMLLLETADPQQTSWPELTEQLKQHLHNVPSTLILDSTWAEDDLIDDDEYEQRRAFLRGQVWVMCNLPHHLDWSEEDEGASVAKSLDEGSSDAPSPTATFTRRDTPMFVIDSTESEDAHTTDSSVEECWQCFVNLLYKRCDPSGSIQASSNSLLSPPGRTSFEINKLVPWAHEQLRCTTGTLVAAVRLLVLQGVVEKHILNSSISCDNQLYYFSTKFVPSEPPSKSWRIGELRDSIESLYPTRPPLAQPDYDDHTVPIHCELYGYRLEASIKADVLNLKAIILSCPSKVIISFRGTDNNENVWLDFKLWQGNVDNKNSWDAFMSAITKKARRVRTNACGCSRTNSERVFGTNGSVARCLLSCRRAVTCSAEQIKCHQGFIDAWSVFEKSIFRVLSVISPVTDPRSLFFTGHSLGGAIAQLAAINCVTKLYTKPRTVRVYSLSSPRVGNINFSATYNYHVPHSFRLVVDGDPVTNVPFSMSGYHHAGTEVHLGRSEISPSWVIDPTWLDKGAFPYPRTTSHLMLDIKRAVNMVLTYLDWNFQRFNSALSPPSKFPVAKKQSYIFPWFQSSEPHRILDADDEDYADSDHCPDKSDTSSLPPEYSPISLTEVKVSA